MNNKNVVRLEYEAYNTMAMKEALKICDQIRNNWNSIKHIAIYHRIGEVKIKESSIIIAISAPHRKGIYNIFDSYYLINKHMKYLYRLIRGS